MPFTLVVVTPLIAIMKDQVKHFNKIRVAAAMIGEDVDEAVKSGRCILKSQIVSKGLQEEKLGNQVAAIAIDELPSITEWYINFPCNCCAYSLLELTICIETAFYRNERYLFVT